MRTVRNISTYRFISFKVSRNFFTNLLPPIYGSIYLNSFIRFLILPDKENISIHIIYFFMFVIMLSSTIYQCNQVDLLTFIYFFYKFVQSPTYSDNP